MRNLTGLILMVVLMASTANASATRTITLDSIQSSDLSKTWTPPASTDTLVGRSTTDTLTNKTLTSPTINSPTGIVKGDVGLGNVDNTSDATKNAATATLTNKTLTSPVINSPTGITKTDVGLGNVDNTSDATKNSATATLTNKTIDYNSNTITNLPSAAANVVGSTGSPTLITAVGGISFSGSSYNNLNFIAGNGGAVDITANPQIAAGSLVGQELQLIGEHATNTVKLDDGTGLALNGSWVGGLNSSITLRWDGTVWVEKARQ